MGQRDREIVTERQRDRKRKKGRGGEMRGNMIVSGRSHANTVYT